MVAPLAARADRRGDRLSVRRSPIWRLLGADKTQQQVANELGWSREKVKVYAALQAIDEKAWQIVGTTVRNFDMVREDGVVPSDGTIVPFTENLLRVLVPLSAEARAPRWSPIYAAMAKTEREAAWAAARLPKVEGEPPHVASLRDLIANAASQQCELCRFLARGKNNHGSKFGKADFTLQAQKYRARNALEQIGWEMICFAIPEGDERGGYAENFYKEIEKPIFEDESGMDVKAYAASVGRARTTVQREAYAAEVASAVPINGHELDQLSTHLVEIHAARRWLWPALVHGMVGAPETETAKEIKPWTVEQTRAMVARFKDAPEKLPEWFSDDAPTDLIGGALRVRDVADMIKLVTETRVKITKASIRTRRPPDKPAN